MGNTETIGALRDDIFKDAKPLDTVDTIKSILNKYNIETDEHWFESGVPYCYSLRITVKGTTFGTNGKGLTKEFALASAYGELMERLQLGFLGKIELQKDGNYSVNDGLSELVSAKKLFNNNRNWYELYSEKLKFYTGESLGAEKILMQYADEKGNLLATPFYCINKKTIEYLPTKLNKNVYTANGCAAGNSPEEAIVQALSEIVERHYLTEMMFEDITPPDIPEEILKKYEAAYAIISYLREKNFKVTVKDCTCGSKFPIVSVCIVDEDTGKYHTHFGANPVFEIALERALTESFQGRNIRELSEIVDFRFQKEGFFDIKNLKDELVFGVSEKLPGFFVGEPKYQYNNDMGFSGENNKELLKQCIEYFSAKGFDILVRDYSCLGFCTYRVIIPGYSEVFVHRLSEKNNELHYHNSAMKTLRNPSLATLDERVGLLMSLARSNSGFTTESRLHVNLTPKEEGHFMAATLAYINFDLKKYSETLKYINTMLLAKFIQNEEFLICVRRYITLLMNKYSTEQIKNLLYYFHKEESVNKLFAYVEENKNPLDEFTLHCDSNCSEACLLYKKCCNKTVSELADVIFEKTKEMDFNEAVQKINKIL